MDIRESTSAVSQPRHHVAPATTDERYVGAVELRTILPVSEMTIWRWQRDPRVGFPRPTKLGASGRNYWWLPDIRAWEASRRKPAGEA